MYSVRVSICISSGSLAFAFTGGSDTKAQLESSPFDIIHAAEHQDKSGFSMTIKSSGTRSVLDTLEPKSTSK